MSQINKSVVFEKELDDVMEVIVQVIEAIKAKQSVSQIAGSLLPELIDLVGEVPQIPADFKESSVAAYETVGYHLGELVAALVAPVSSPVAPAPAPAA